jgi:hypothetical protein
MSKDKIILMTRERAFKHFRDMKKWEKENTLIKFILRGFKYTPIPRA